MGRVDNEPNGNDRNVKETKLGMREIWREKSALRRHRNQAMKLIGRVDSSEGHYAKEREQLLDSLSRKGLLQSGADIGDVLEINVEHMLSRRLQSVVYYKGLAPSMRAARNLIVHGHICIGKQRMTVPGYHVLKEEEDSLQYTSNSPFADPEHSFRKELETRRVSSEDNLEDTPAEGDSENEEAPKEVE